MVASSSGDTLPVMSITSLSVIGLANHPATLAPRFRGKGDPERADASIGNGAVFIDYCKKCRVVRWIDDKQLAEICAAFGAGAPIGFLGQRKTGVDAAGPATEVSAIGD
jgi:hypothetical protein